MLKRKPISFALGAVLSLGMLAPAQASYFTNLITSGAVNDLEDQSREAFFDVNNNGLVDAGDVLTGFLRIDDKTAPAPGVDTSQHIYAIFSQEITSIAGGVAEFGGVTAGNGLSLAELGVAGAIATDVISVYSSNPAFSVDLILDSPGDRTGNGSVTLADYFDLILTEGTLDIRAGISSPTTCTGGTADCFQANGLIASGTLTNSLIGLPSSITVGNFVGAFETSLDPAGYELLDVVPAGAFYAGPITTLSEIALSNGAARGAVNVVNYLEWTDGSELSAVRQCTDLSGSLHICGFSDDADFHIFPVPEPSNIALLGLGLLGLGGRLRKRGR